MHIVVTHVDISTRLACTTEPMRHGPSFPAVNSLVIDWYNGSDWPISTINGICQTAPLFYGTCDNDSFIDLPGVIEVIDESTFISRKRTEYYARQPFPSWIFDEKTLTWSAPVPMPTDGKMYKWDEFTTGWIGR